MKISIYQPAQEDAVIQLWKACELVKPWNDPHKDIARKLNDSPDLFFVGHIDEELVAAAMAGYEGHRGWVNYLAVSPQHRGASLGRKMMEHIEEVLLARGCPKINLQVRESNTAVLDFYAAIGYQVDAAVSLGKRLIPDGPPAATALKNDPESDSG